MTRLAIGYGRVSTARQAEEGVSLDMQDARIRSHCEHHGWRLAKVFRDEGLSGRATHNRPQLARALNKVTAVRGVLVVYSLSRLARSVVDAYAIARRLEAAKADLSSVTEPIDTTTAMGKAFFGLLAVFAQLESDQTSERVRASLQHCLQTLGYYPCGNQPYGWRLVDGKLAEDPQEQAVREIVFLRRSEGKLLREIAAELDARGFPTPGALRGYARAARHWSGQMIHRILRRRGKPGRQPLPLPQEHRA